MYAISATNLRLYMQANCLLLDGTAPMTAQLQGYVGTEGTPGYGFDGDEDTGIYRVSANLGGLVAGGLGYLSWSSAGIQTLNGVSFIGPLQGIVGGVTPAAGHFTTLTASTSMDGVLGGVTPAAATVTTLTTTGAATIAGLATLSAGGTLTPAATPATTSLGYLGLPQLAKSGDFTLTMTEAGKQVYWSATATATIPANATVAYPIGTVMQLAVDSGHTLTVAITSNTLIWLPSGSTGSRTVTGPGFLTIVKVTATSWWGYGLGTT